MLFLGAITVHCEFYNYSTCHARVNIHLNILIFPLDCEFVKSRCYVLISSSSVFQAPSIIPGLELRFNKMFIYHLVLVVGGNSEYYLKWKRVFICFFFKSSLLKLLLLITKQKLSNNNILNNVSYFNLS